MGPMEIDKETISLMPYLELRKIAKQFGIKANMKAEKLQKAILQAVDEAAEKNHSEEIQDKMAEVSKSTEIEASKLEITQPVRNRKNTDFSHKAEEVAVINPEITQPIRNRKNTDLSHKPEEVAVNNPRKRKRIRRGTYDVEDEENTAAPNKISIKDTAVSKDPPKRVSPRRNGRPQPIAAKKLKSNIPCLKGKLPFTPSRTPNFARIHAKAFAAMDSIDTFLEKKQQRSEILFKSPIPVMKVKGIPQENKIVSEVSQIPRFNPNKKAANFNFGLTPSHKDKVFKFSAKNSGNKVAKGKTSTMKLMAENPQNLRMRNFSTQKIRTTKGKPKEIIKGVRTNRRFELQMMNRGIAAK